MSSICQYCGHKLTDRKCLNPACPGRLRGTPPSREERIEKATEKIWHLIDRAANQSTVAKEEAHAILTELMEGKP